jgi:hypothetical protein
MENDPTAPITRLTDSDRLIAFQKQSKSIYNKFSPYDAGGSGAHVGSRQPFVWTKISDSENEKNLTKYDTQTFPIGSTIRDEKRLAKFLTSGTGLIYIGKQFLLQRQNAFNETRIYNPLSVLSAAASKASTGLIERPKRFIETNSVPGNMIASSLLNMFSLGMSNTEQSVPPGAASDGGEINKVISNQASAYGGATRGLVRFETGQRGLHHFSDSWLMTKMKGDDRKFLKRLGDSLTDKLKSYIPSTTPHRDSNGKNSTWEIRPEYGSNSIGSEYISDSHAGAYESMLLDAGGVLSFKNNNSPDPDVSQANSVHFYAPNKKYTDTSGPTRVNIEDDQITRLKKAVSAFNNGDGVDLRSIKSIERYSNINGYSDKLDYNSIPSNADQTNLFSNKLTDRNFTITSRQFSTSPNSNNGKSKTNTNIIGSEDTYNALNVLSSGERDSNLGYDQSKDIIFFYFHDLVNNKYIPFRATLSGINEMHSPEWEDVSYIGRADKLYIYKGFSREINFAFTVYANSLKEMVPMWKRINYLVGLSRPSKYTEGANTSDQFIYPPMVNLRIGDMFVDQPCVISAIGINVPDDALWETQRGDGKDYSYLQGIKDFTTYSTKDKIYQLPTKVDITVNAKILEKKRSIANDDHYFIGSKSIQNEVAVLESYGDPNWTDTDEIFGVDGNPIT